MVGFARAEIRRRYSLLAKIHKVRYVTMNKQKKFLENPSCCFGKNRIRLQPGSLKMANHRTSVLFIEGEGGPRWSPIPVVDVRI